MLAGVGGRTVEEAKERMTNAEFMSWVAYTRRTGPLNLGTRMEFLMARQSTRIVRSSMGGKGDFVEEVRYQEEQHASLDDVAKLMGVKGVK